MEQFGHHERTTAPLRDKGQSVLQALRRRVREFCLDVGVAAEVMLDAWLELEEKPGPRPVTVPVREACDRAARTMS